MVMDDGCEKGVRRMEVEELCSRIFVRRGVLVPLEYEDRCGAYSGRSGEPRGRHGFRTNKVSCVTARVSKNMCDERGSGRLAIRASNNKILAALGNLSEHLGEGVDRLAACERGAHFGIFGRRELGVAANQKCICVRWNILSAIAKGEADTSLLQDVFRRAIALGIRARDPPPRLFQEEGGGAHPDPCDADDMDL